VGDETQELTDEWAMEQWAKMAPLIETMVQRIQDPADFLVQPGSELAADDADSNPYRVSHCARACLTAGVDHLHAMKTLIIDEPRLLHAAADYSLIRGALENFATAFWVLHPHERTIRIERALRWMAQNYTDQDKATGALGLPNDIGLQARHAKVAAVAQKAGCVNVLGGYASTHAVKYAEKHSQHDFVLLMWQVCSGFAHGRQWANLGMNAMEQQPTEEEGIATIRLTTDHKRLAVATLPSFKLMDDVVGLFTNRSRAV
jgi:hypothetical protein